MNGNRKEIIRAAIQLEKDGRKFYLDTAGKTSSEFARRMFESFAEDELRHMEWIKALSPGTSTAESANRELYARLRHIFADAPEDLRLAAELSDDDIKAISIAMGMEDKSVLAYEEWAREDEREDIQALCKALAGQERFHRQILENTKEYLDHTAD